MSDPKIIVALDYSDEQPALELVARLEPALCRLKVGMELFTTARSRFIEQLMQHGFEIFIYNSDFKAAFCKQACARKARKARSNNCNIKFRQSKHLFIKNILNNQDPGYNFLIIL